MHARPTTGPILLRAFALALIAGGVAAGDPVAPRADLVLHLDAAGPGWERVKVIADGAEGGAASFDDPAARIDVGACGATSAEPFTLSVSIRTREAGFATPLMARGEGGGEVAMSLVMGREPGCVSFEAWSWPTVRLVSRTRVDDGRWHRLEAPYDPASRTAILFVDGRAEASGVLGEGGSPNAVLRLGNNIGADQPFRGDLDEVSVVRRTTHAERFAALAAAAPVTSLEAKRAALAALRGRLLPRSTPDPGDAAAWGRRREAIRAGVADALGLTPLPPRGPLDATVHGTFAGDGLDVSRVSWASWPGTRATGWLWLPHRAGGGRRPALLSLHGHFAGGAIDPVEQARAAYFARDGWVVLAPDTVHVEDVASGVSAGGAMAWDNVRALDLLLARQDVDPARVAMTGASGGAQQTMTLMALEDRVAAAAPVCMITYWQEILFDDTAHCTCNHVPRLAAVADEPEICAVFAPRPAFFGSVTGDWTHDFPRLGWPELRRVWRLLGHEDRVATRHGDEGHNYDRPFREAVHAFLAKNVLGDEAPASERPWVSIARERLLALGPPPNVPPDRAALAREFVARRPRVTDLRAVAPSLSWTVARGPFVPLGDPDAPAEWRRAVVQGPDGVAVPLLWREAKGAGEAPWVVAASPSGKASFLLEGPAWLSRAPRVALVDPRFTGEWAPFAGAWRRNGILLGRGEGYEQAHDLALVCESLPGTAAAFLLGEGSCGVSALIAAQLSRRIAMVVAPDLGRPFAEDGNRLPLCPEILRFGDLPALVAAVPAPRRLLVGGAGSAVGLRAAPGAILTAAEAALTAAAVSDALVRPP